MSAVIGTLALIVMAPFWTGILLVELVSHGWRGKHRAERGEDVTYEGENCHE